MNITPSLLISAIGCTPARAEAFAGPLSEACTAYGIKLSAYFLATIAHESNALANLDESLNYASSRLVAVFGDHRITQEQADQFGRNSEHPANERAIANIVYGGEWGARNLGNTQPEDGFRFRGRGPGMLTGRSNYVRFRNRLRERMPDAPDFEAEPELLALPRWGALSFADFWDRNGLEKLADAGAFEALTRRVNGGLIGWDDRKQRLARAQKALAALSPEQHTTAPLAADDPPSEPAINGALPPDNAPDLADQAGNVTTRPYMPAGEGQPQEAHVPIPAIVAAVLPSIIESIPKLGKLFGSGSAVAERNVKAAEMAVGIVQEAVGAVNAQDAAERLKSDPALVATATKAIESAWLSLTEAGGDGISGARAADTAFVQASTKWYDFLKSPSFLVALLLTPLVYIIVLSLVGMIGTAEWSDDVRAGLAGSIISAIIGGLVGYYFGQTTSRNRTTA